MSTMNVSGVSEDQDNQEKSGGKENTISVLTKSGITDEQKIQLYRRYGGSIHERL
jgi:hypothetical protein